MIMDFRVSPEATINLIEETHQREKQEEVEAITREATVEVMLET